MDHSDPPRRRTWFPRHTLVWLAAVACVVLPLTLARTTESASLSTEDGNPSGQGVTLETRDGLLTATFPEASDETVLRAVVPELAARGVRAVSLHGASVQDTRALAGLPELIALDISGTQVRDLQPLAQLTGLQSLNLQFAPVHDLTPLAGLTSLLSLNISGSDVRDLTPLTRLVNLRHLALAVTKVDDLTPLTGLTLLTTLDLGGTFVSDARPIAGMTHLRTLNLNGTQVTDLRPLAGLTDLQRLDLGGTQVSDLAPIGDLHGLEWLDLEGTKVADIGPLARIGTLRFLALGGSRVPGVGQRENPPLPPLRVDAAEQASADPVLYWNDQTNRAIQITRTDPFLASRDLALESIAVLDTVRSISGAPAFLVRLPRPGAVSVHAAVSGAAHTLLLDLFPADATSLNAALAAALASEPPGPMRDRGLAFGRAVAQAVIMRREADGADATVPVRTGTAPGQWRPTPPGFEPPMDPQWATMQPFALARPDQFRPAGPPALDSAAFRQARDIVAQLGAAHSKLRTAEQTEIAHYWSDAIGTYAPAGHWNAIAASLAGPMKLGEEAEAELFAELNIAIADASIAMADAKYDFWEWRPITAIHAGDAETPGNPDWTPLLETPNHPSYISGHSTVSGAAAAVLTSWFGVRPFTFSSASLPGVTRNFTSFDQAAEEAAASRVYGGIHYPFDNTDGLATGRAVGTWTLGVFQRLEEDRGPFLMVGGSMDMMAPKDSHDVMGCALDNAAPVTWVTAQLDDGTKFSVPVDDHGMFSLPRQRIGAGRHALVIAATSATGRTSSVRAEIAP